MQYYFFNCRHSAFGASGKEQTNAGCIRDVGSIPESRRSLGGGHGSPLQCSCLENPMDRGAWWAAAYRVTSNRLK